MSRRYGMSRSSAALTRAAVLGPSARRWAKRMNASRSSREVEVARDGALRPQRPRQQRVEQRERQVAGLEADVLLLVLVDDVVHAVRPAERVLPKVTSAPAAFWSSIATCSSDVAEPGALVLLQAPDEPAGLAVGAAVLPQTGQRSSNGVVELRAQSDRRPRLERAQIHASGGSPGRARRGSARCRRTSRRIFIAPPLPRPPVRVPTWPVRARRVLRSKSPPVGQHVQVHADHGHRRRRDPRSPSTSTPCPSGRRW